MALVGPMLAQPKNVAGVEDVGVEILGWRFWYVIYLLTHWFAY